MSGYSWTLPPAVETATNVSPRNLGRQIDKLYGRDIWFDHSAQGVVQRQVTPDGDWLMVEGIAALRQAIIRRIITNPGEWQTSPDYGVGARNYVKERNTRASREALSNRIKDQLSQDPRVAKVEQVVVESSDALLRIAVQVTPKAHISPNPVGVVLELN